MVKIIFFNILFIILLTLPIQTKVQKDKFLSLSSQDLLNNYLTETTTDDILYNMISKYRNKLLRNTIFSDMINKNELSLESNNNANKILEKNLLQSMLIENKKNENLDVYFNTTDFIWENIDTFGEAPVPRRGHSMVLADTYLIIFGGSDLNLKFYNDVYFFDIIKKTWMKVNCFGNVPSPRSDHSATLYGTTMWIFGGASNNGYLNDLYSLNIETREWKKHEFIGKTPNNRSGHSAILDEQAKIFIFGGYSELGHANDIFVINLLAERYENPLLSGKGPNPREKSIMLYLEKNIYIFGGHQNGINFNDFYKLNLNNLLWEKIDIKGFIPEVNQGFTGERVGKKFYLIGGCDFENKFCNEETFIFDFTNSTWTKLSSYQQNSQIASDYLNKFSNNFVLYSNRSQMSLQFFRGALITFGGCEMNKKCYNDINVLNIMEACPNDCSGNGNCKRKAGCECNNDFILHDCSLKIKCKEDCNKNGLCKSNAKCSCFSGWTGETCSSIINCPKNCTSPMNGMCLLDGNCDCKTGFLGKDCSNNTNIINVDPILNLINSNDKSIEKQNEILSEEFKNIIEIQETRCLNDCSGNGDCNVILKKCECKESFSGEDCSIKFETKIEVKNETKPVIVKPKPPQRKIEIPKKIWRIFYINNTLYQENDQCEGNCNNKGICLNSTCLCDQGFTGDKCSMTYKDILEKGYSVKKFIKPFIIVGVSAMIFYLILNILKKR